MIKLAAPMIEEDELRAVQEVLLSGNLVQGKCVAEFEQTVAGYVGAKHAVAVSNCTAALHLSLLALGVGQGDKVLVTAYSWPATANVIELCGAQPIFVDIDPKTFNVDPHALSETLKTMRGKSPQAGRVRAILPVHTFGQIAEMSEIMQIAAQYDLPVLEDAACALGSRLDGRQAGTWGVIGCFSFHPRKAITTGEGGMIITDAPKIVKQLRALRNHGLDPDAISADFVLPGFNYRMTEFQAALGISQMAKLEGILAKRRTLAQFYDKLLKGTPLEIPTPASQDSHVYQSYVVLLPEAAAGRRTDIIRILKESTIETTIGTYHMPLTTYFAKRYGYVEGDFPVTDLVFSRSLSLPFHQKITAEDQERVVYNLVEALQRA
jgi:perosamine synthetase